MKSSTHRRLLLLASFVFVAFGLGMPVHAQDKTSEIDEIFSWAAADCPGCAVAVSLNGELVVNRAYGSADLEREVPITPNTIFDIGSVQKQFVAAAVLVLVDDGNLSLSDDVRTYIPELPDYGHTVTIDHLLTHTSGIRDWTGILPLAAGNDDALTVILRQRGLNFVPGEAWGYSNSGFVLAREIVARRSGMSFAEFTRTRLFEPLGMNSTAFCRDIHDVNGERALAYDKRGDRWTPAMMLGNERGGGGIFSTAADLVTWNDALTNNRLGAFVSEKLQEPVALNNGRKLDYGRGLGLGTYSGTTVISHSGSADGYKTWLGRYPEHGLSIAITCNSGDGTDRTDFAHRIFHLFVPNAGAGVTEAGPPPAISDDAVLEVNNKTGLFFNDETGEFMRLVVDRGRFRIARGPGLELVDENHFRRWGAHLMYMSGDAFELHFLSNDEFELESMDGGTTRYRRAHPFAPTANELNAFAGRYRSDEIGSIFVFEPQEDGLVLHLEHVPEKSLDIKPADRDTFQWRLMTLRFRRDKNGAVVGFDYSNPALRNVEFTRLSDRP